MPPRRPLAAVSVLLLAAAAPVPASAARPPAGRWSGPARYATAPSAKGVETAAAAPRVSVDADGTAGMVFKTVTRRPELRLAARRSTGRFGPARLITSRFTNSYSVAAAGRGIVTVAWTDRAGAHAAQLRDGRLTRHLLAPEPASAIDSVQLVRDRKDGYVLVASRFASGRSTVTAQDLDDSGAALGPPQDLGAGSFGNSARETSALVVDPAGTAYFAYGGARNADSTKPATTVRVRPHGGAWGAGVVVPVTDARLAVASGSGAVLVGTDQLRGSEVASFGQPTLFTVTADGNVSAPLTPTGVRPRTSFQPSAVQLEDGRYLTLFSQRSQPRAFSVTAPVLARTLDAPSGQTVAGQRLTASPDAAEPYLVSVPGTGGALAIWSGPHGWGTALTDDRGVLRAVRPPSGPPPTPFHLNPTNRDVRAGGSYVAVAWQRGARVSVSVVRTR